MVGGRNERSPTPEGDNRVPHQEVSSLTGDADRRNGRAVVSIDGRFRNEFCMKRKQYINNPVFFQTFIGK